MAGGNSGVMSDVKCKVRIDVKNINDVMLGGICGENGFAPTDDEGKINNAMVNSEITLATSGVYSKDK